MRKNEKHVILCLLEVARRGAKFGKCFFSTASLCGFPLFLGMLWLGMRHIVWVNNAGRSDDSDFPRTVWQTATEDV